MYTRLNKQLQALVGFCMLRVTQSDPSESQFPNSYTIWVYIILLYQRQN